ncbi:MAG: hypothetical protein CGU29_12295 [Candidatus Dactylopiibacterium carminicum]|uniref:Methyl-accepting chemotaxis protein n=1 Tax=Candidatus Dactylopiibacterium carminicum TaxID=857335 RepID=A0A272EQE0_9RHOO|nr:methyl-accepting chemotaxis protein [Candidatus Dactylopiibacterium carminicum]KAF7598565.1 methyl-accepting chemotaxis protein [Candidatus Dactylopiibacterium carminicum]PAS92301.1 MAG: hypothetical protein CGU29_12295 [Candidatus Dactylopiibacterium carminicum]PAS98226.1 MAG: hypothetical protein BSR46_12470 [Candidatus Dactylopiibacterium carminicum]
MTIRKKLILLVLISAFSVILLGGYGLWQTWGLSARLVQGLDQAMQQSALQLSVAQAQIRFKTQVQEWKNILIRGNDRAAYERYWRQFEDEEKWVAEALTQVAGQMQSGGMDAAPALAALGELKLLGERYRAALKEFDGEDAEAGKRVDVAVRGMDRSLASALDKLEEEIGSHARANALARGHEAQAVASASAYVTATVAVVVLLLLAISGWLVARSVLRAVTGLQGTMQKVEQDWDLALRATAQGGDELSQCAVALNAMLSRFQQIVQGIHRQVEALQIQSVSIASAVQQVREAADTQNGSAAAVAAAIEELSVSVGQVGDAAQEAEQLAHESRTGAEQGGQSVIAGNRQLEELLARVQLTADKLATLGNHSDAISGIVQTVKEIADQTNLLALNAAIEAARAGEQGRGFAVVADEVRKLAEDTGRATSRIQELVNLIQGSTRDAIQDAHGVVEGFEQQMRQARESGSLMEGIAQAAVHASAASVRINDALREQTSASQLIAGQVEQIASMSESNTQAVGIVDQGTRSLHALAAELAQAVRRFKV